MTLYIGIAMLAAIPICIVLAIAHAIGSLKDALIIVFVGLLATAWVIVAVHLIAAGGAA